MDILGIPVKIENRQELYDLAYLAEQQGIHLSTQRLLFNPHTGHAYCPGIEMPPHAGRGYLSDDIQEIECELASGVDDSENWKLDDTSIRKLHELKVSIAREGLAKLLAEG